MLALFGLLSAVALATSPKSIKNVQVHVRDPRSHAGEAMTITSTQFESGEFCSTLRALLQPSVKSECKVYTEHGVRLYRFAEVKNNDRLFIISGGLFFVWPGISTHNVTLLDNPHRPVIMEPLHTTPRIFRLHNFLTDAEVDQLVEGALALKLTRSTGGLQKVGSTDPNNKGEYTSHRTSDNSWDQTSPLATELKKRSFDLLRIHPFQEAMADGLQVVRYQTGQFYHSHHDFFNIGATNDGWNFDPTTGGSNRIATVFLYLSDTDVGGETVFPEAGLVTENISAKAEIEQLKKDVLKPNSLEARMVDVCRTHFHVKPSKGDAILFYHQDMEGHLDQAALHGACPVLRGEKWGANLWVWNGPVYQPGGLPKEDDVKTGLAHFKNTLSIPVNLYYTDRMNNNREFVAKIEPQQTHSVRIASDTWFFAQDDTFKPHGRFRMSKARAQTHIIPRLPKEKAPKTDL
jgi:prolyl 4-hydroxylase